MEGVNFMALKYAREVTGDLYGIASSSQIFRNW